MLLEGQQDRQHRQHFGLAVLNQDRQPFFLGGVGGLQRFQ
jgi:hypothetical protein